MNKSHVYEINCIDFYNFVMVEKTEQRNMLLCMRSFLVTAQGSNRTLCWQYCVYIYIYMKETIMV